jgi:hypothetical protein
VQVLDLDPETRSKVLCEGRSIDGILEEMIRDEGSCQRRYSELLGQGPGQVDAEASPLPVGETDVPPSLETNFEHIRGQTLALLERASSPWPPELLEAVKAQVQKDRVRTTQIAECRKAHFETDQRPDLNQPITSDPAPHVESA